jgi:hypothetical protein
MSRTFRLFGVTLAGSSTPTQTLRVTYPANAWLTETQTETSGAEGTWQGTCVGCWHPVTEAHYLYITQDDGNGRQIGVDPGPYEPTLAGMVGVPAALPAGTLTRAQVATAVASGWNTGPSPVVATATGGAVVDFVGDFDADATAAAGPGTEWLARNTEATLAGAQEFDAPGVANVAVDFMAWCQVDPTYLPTTAARIVGIRYQGTNVRIAIARGGADGLPAGAAIVYDSGALSGGGSTWHSHHFVPGEVFVHTPGVPVYIGVNGTTGGLSQSRGAFAQDVGWLTTAGNRIFRTGASTGVSTPFGATVPAASGGNFPFGFSIQIMAQPLPAFGSFAWQSMVLHDDVRNPAPPDVVALDSRFASFSTSMPVVEGLEIQSARVFFVTHTGVPLGQIRFSLSESAGPMSIGETSGSGLGWVEILGAPIDIADAGELRIGGKSSAPGTALQQGVTFGGVGNVVGKPGWSLAATTEAGELEYNAAQGETWMDFDSDVATLSPLAFDSAPIQPNISPGMAVRIGISGFSMQANP